MGHLLEALDVLNTASPDCKQQAAQAVAPALQATVILLLLQATAIQVFLVWSCLEHDGPSVVTIFGPVFPAAFIYSLQHSTLRHPPSQCSMMLLQVMHKSGVYKWWASVWEVPWLLWPLPGLQCSGQPQMCAASPLGPLQLATLPLFQLSGQLAVVSQQLVYSIVCLTDKM